MHPWARTKSSLVPMYPILVWLRMTCVIPEWSTRVLRKSHPRNASDMGSNPNSSNFFSHKNTWNIQTNFSTSINLVVLSRNKSTWYMRWASSWMLIPDWSGSEAEMVMSALVTVRVPELGSAAILLVDAARIAVASWWVATPHRHVKLLVRNGKKIFYC